MKEKQYVFQFATLIIAGCHKIFVYFSGYGDIIASQSRRGWWWVGSKLGEAIMAGEKALDDKEYPPAGYVTTYRGRKIVKNEDSSWTYEGKKFRSCWSAQIYIDEQMSP